MGSPPNPHIPWPHLISDHLNTDDYYYGIVYFDLDGKWKILYSDIALDTEDKAWTQYHLYLRGREHWNLRVVKITRAYHLEEVPYDY
jgi:hypothetical protein